VRFFIDGLKPSIFAKAMQGRQGLYPARLRDTIYNHIGTHDTERPATARLNPGPPAERVDHMAYGDYARVRKHSEYKDGQIVHDGSYKLEAGPDEIDEARKLSKQLATYLLTAPGMPVINYGDEIGLAGDNDPGCRRPMLWEETAAGKPDIELREHYRTMARLRNETPSLKYGSYEIVSADDERRILVMLRRYKGESSFVFFNNSEVDQDISFLLGEGYDGAAVTDRVSGLAHDISEGELKFKLSAKGSAVFVARNGGEAQTMSAIRNESVPGKAQEIENIIAIGGSRYGYKALEEIIKRLPADHPPVVAAEHLDHFEKLAGGEFPRFIRESGRNIILADDDYFGDSLTKDIVLEKGMVVVAKFVHVLRDSGGRAVARVCRDETMLPQYDESGAVDVLYASAAEHFKKNLILIQTSGLGYDGVWGAEQEASSGAAVITQKVDPDGPFAGAGKMPSKVLEAVPGARNLPLEEIAAAVMGVVKENMGSRPGIEDLVADCVGDIRREEELAWSLQSAFTRFTRRVGTENKLIVAIEEGVTEKGFDKERFEKAVNEWKDSVVKLEEGDIKKKDMRRLLDNIVLTFFKDKADLEAKLDENGVSGKDTGGNYIFVYTSDASKAASYRGMGTDVRPVMIREDEKEKEFYPGYYYPLAEIVALSLNQELLNVDIDAFMAGLEKRGINLEELGIDDISDDPELGFLVFTILPKIERSPGGGRADRFEKFLRFMKSA
jgi:hypothetical protein